MVAPQTPAELRELIRNGEHTENTSGPMPGYVQCNLVIVPEAYADDFERFCQLNNKACPLIEKSPKPGDSAVDALGQNINVCTDFPEYQIFKHGELNCSSHNIEEFWQIDSVYFLLGCSFSFEEALIAAGIEIRNISENKNVPMFKTNIPCEPSGPFSGNLVVSMRPMTPQDAERANQICKQFPKVHGEPVAIGNPESLGIHDIFSPDFGDAVTVNPGEVPVFWACGVTPQLALVNARLPLTISHSPGCMLVTDRLNTELMSNDR